MGLFFVGSYVWQKRVETQNKDDAEENDDNFEASDQNIMKYLINLKKDTDALKKAFNVVVEEEVVVKPEKIITFDNIDNETPNPEEYEQNYDAQTPTYH